MLASVRPIGICSKSVTNLALHCGYPRLPSFACPKTKALLTVSGKRYYAKYYKYSYLVDCVPSRDTINELVDKIGARADSPRLTVITLRYSNSKHSRKMTSSLRELGDEVKSALEVPGKRALLLESKICVVRVSLFEVQ